MGWREVKVEEGAMASVQELASWGGGKVSGECKGGVEGGVGRWRAHRCAQELGKE